MGIDILGVDILGIDILGIDILAPTRTAVVPEKRFFFSHSYSCFVLMSTDSWISSSHSSLM